MEGYIGEFVIVRSRDQGVVCGYLEAICGNVASISEARQIHGWTDGANTLFEMSLKGCGTARISEPVAKMMMIGVCGVIPCTDKAKRNLQQSRWNERPKSSAA